MKYEELKLSELVDTISDTRKIDKDKVILVNTSDVLAGDVLNHTYTDNCKLRGQFKKRFKQNDILYSEIRPANKRFAYVDFDSEDYIASTKLMVLRRKSDKITNRYLYYCLTSDSFIERMQHLAESRSGTFPQITFDVLKAESIYLPSVDNQNKITNILDSINDKVKINNEINNNLYEQAVAIYKDTFSGIENGDKTIGEYITPKRGKNLLTREALDGDIPVVAGGLEPSAYHNQFNTNYPVITISASGANAGYTNLWNIPVWASDCSYIDDSITKNVYFWYIVLKTRQKEIYDSQTGSAQPHIYPQHIAEMPIDELNIDDVKNFNKLVEPLFRMIGENKKENSKLSELRDTLLPKLMNGEIDLDNIEI